MIQLPYEYSEESEDPTCEGEMVVIRDKKSSQKVQNPTSLHEIDKEILLIAPVSHDIDDPTPEEDRSSIECYILEYVLADALLGRILV